MDWIREGKVWDETREKLIKCGVDARTLPEKQVRGLQLGHFNFDYADLDGADLSYTDLSYCYFEGAHLRGANLRGADLHGSTFYKTDMSLCLAVRAIMYDAVIRDSNLSEACFSAANLSRASIAGSDLSGIDLAGADLFDVGLRVVNLARADLHSANLYGAGLHEVNLDGVYINYRTIGLHEAPQGSLIGWGKKSGHLVKMLIPKEAKRSCATTRKFRAEYIITVEIDDGALMHVDHHPRGYASNAIYHVGRETFADDWDEDRWAECSHGIHFFLTRAEAEEWSE